MRADFFLDWVYDLALHINDALEILINYVQFIIIRLFSFSHYRAPRPERPQARRGPAEQGDQLAEGSRDVQPGGAEEAAVLHAHLGQAASVAIALGPGDAEDLLFETGGPCASAAAHRAHVRFKHPVLMIDR